MLQRWWLLLSSLCWSLMPDFSCPIYSSQLLHRYSERDVLCGHTYDCNNRHRRRICASWSERGSRLTLWWEGEHDFPSGSRHISHSEVLNDVLLRLVPEVFEHARSWDNDLSPDPFGMTLDWWFTATKLSIHFHFAQFSHRFLFHCRQVNQQKTSQEHLCLIQYCPSALFIWCTFM